MTIHLRHWPWIKGVIKTKTPDVTVRTNPLNPDKQIIKCVGSKSEGGQDFQGQYTIHTLLHKTKFAHKVAVNL